MQVQITLTSVFPNTIDFSRRNISHWFYAPFVHTSKYFQFLRAEYKGWSNKKNPTTSANTPSSKVPSWRHSAFYFRVKYFIWEDLKFSPYSQLRLYTEFQACNIHSDREPQEISGVTNFGPYTAMILYIFLQLYFKSSPRLFFVNLKSVTEGHTSRIPSYKSTTVKQLGNLSPYPFIHLLWYCTGLYTCIYLNYMIFAYDRFTSHIIFCHEFFSQILLTLKCSLKSYT